jgi:predicted metal-dependent hydrolase
MLVDKFSGKTKSDREVVARHYATWFVPNDKKIAPYSVRYKIEIKRDYYEKHRNKPDELRNCVIHELAHCKVPKTHGKDFKKVAKCLGADDNHARANWE